jgi:hypothetical protein
MAQHVAFPGRPRQRLALAVQRPGLGRVVAQEIHRLANFGDPVIQCLAALFGQQEQQPAALRLQQIGRMLQDSGAPVGRGVLPVAETRARRIHGGIGHLLRGVGHLAHRAHAVDRGQGGAGHAHADCAVDHRCRGAWALMPGHLVQQSRQGRGIAELDARRIAPAIAEQRRGQRQRCVSRAFGRADDGGRPF